MGNKPSQDKKLVLGLEVQEIILHHAYKMKLKISQMQTFPHGLDGLKLWDAGIILSRYIILNSSLFKEKSILQLGSGVGIAGITARKWTTCQKITMSDYHSSIIENIKKNCQKNACDGMNTILLDWTKRQTLKQQFDIIMGSDIVYFGCPVKDLYQVFKTFLKKGGKGIIIIPQRKNYAQLFTNEIKDNEFELKIQELNNPQYRQAVLEDVEKSQYQYPLLKSLKFSVYILIKK